MGFISIFGSMILKGFGTLATIAGSIGLNRLMERLDEWRVPEDLKSVNILKEVDAALSEIRQKSTNAYNQAMDELGALSKKYGGSPNYQGFLRLIRSQAHDKSVEKRANLDKVESSINTITNQAGQLANMSNMYRRGKGAKKDLESIKTQIEGLKSLEQSVNPDNKNNNDKGEVK